MNSYDSGGNIIALLFFGGIGLLIWVAIMQWVISTSTKSAKRFELEKAQFQLLVFIARKLEVNKEEIDLTLGMTGLISKNSQAKKRTW